MRLAVLFATFLVLAPSAFASDGVLEINPACAVHTGCFSGDTPGYPVTIDGSAGRSYRLTGDLIVPDEFTDGITVSANDVGIDLNNLSIVRAGCENTTTDCTPTSGFAAAVRRTSTSYSGLSVRNGSTVGMGYGVLLSLQAEVTNVRARWNRIDGISTGIGSTVSGNTVYQNGEDGIQTSSGSTVSGNTAYLNGEDGIDAGTGSTVSGNTAYRNGSDGIEASNGSTVQGNTAYLNGVDGISAGSGSTVSGNTVYWNSNDGIDCGAGCSIIENAAYQNGDEVDSAFDDGIDCDSGCLVRGNSMRSNEGRGLTLGFDSAYSDNVISANQTGTVAGSGSSNSRGGNFCAGTGTVSSFCP